MKDGKNINRQSPEQQSQREEGRHGQVLPVEAAAGPQVDQLGWGWLSGRRGRGCERRAHYRASTEQMVPAGRWSVLARGVSVITSSSSRQGLKGTVQSEKLLQVKARLQTLNTWHAKKLVLQANAVYM